MRKKLRITLAALLLGAFAWWSLTPREPSYQGQSLTFWLEQYSDNCPLPSGGLEPTNESGRRAETAIRKIGTNAIPTLLQMLQANDSPWKLKLFELLGRQGLVRFNHPDPFRQNIAAVNGFEILGADAKDAAPALIKIYERNILGVSPSWAACALGAIGPPAKIAIPALIKVATNSAIFMSRDYAPGVQAASMDALVRIHANPELVVPALVGHLRDRQNPFPNDTAGVLGTFGAYAKPAIPALIEALQSPDSDLRVAATNALKKIDPEAAAQAGVK